MVCHPRTIHNKQPNKQTNKHTHTHQSISFSQANKIWEEWFSSQSSVLAWLDIIEKRLNRNTERDTHREKQRETERRLTEEKNARGHVDFNRVIIKPGYSQYINTADYIIWLATLAYSLRHHQQHPLMAGGFLPAPQYAPEYLFGRTQTLCTVFWPRVQLRVSNILLQQLTNGVGKPITYPPRTMVQ